MTQNMIISALRDSAFGLVLGTALWGICVFVDKKRDQRLAKKSFEKMKRRQSMFKRIQILPQQ